MLISHVLNGKEQRYQLYGNYSNYNEKKTRNYLDNIY